MPERVVLVLAAEVTNRGVDHPARRVSEATQAAAVLERIGNALKDVELDLRDAGLLDVAADRHEPRSGRLLSATLRVLRAAVVDDPRHRGQCLDVVEQRRPAPGAFDGGEGGSRARLGALALQ